MVRFQQCERGSVAIIGGLVAMALMIATGIAIDHSRALELQAAADYAVLAALTHWPRQTIGRRKLSGCFAPA